MSTISERIRAAALGPTPSNGEQQFPSGWVGSGCEWRAVWGFVVHGADEWYRSGDNDTRRTFLLLVAESLE